MKKVWMEPEDSAFTYEGRIDFECPGAPVFVYPCSYVKFRLNGWFAALAVENHHSYFENSLGVLVDGTYRGKIVLHDGMTAQGETVEQYLLRMDLKQETDLPEDLLARCGNARVYELSPYLDGGEHEITIFKRMDACHYFTFRGLLTEKRAFDIGANGKTREDIAILREKSGDDRSDGGSKSLAKGERRIEVYGDSISCGEVSEAVGRCGMSDPEGHNGIYSNSFYSYPWILARRLGARLHDVSQGGISLRDGEGWFHMPDTVGMLSCYDKIQLNPDLGERKSWDFSRYVPHVVIVAIGQNDAHPEDYMTEDYEGEKAASWRKDYAGFLRKLRGKYPHTLIVCTTTILGHNASWDQAIGEVCEALDDPKIKHFLYSLNGCGTSGHVRIPEAETMAAELQAFLESQGDSIWEDWER